MKEYALKYQDSTGKWRVKPITNARAKKMSKDFTRDTGTFLGLPVRLMEREIPEWSVCVFELF